jgi:hypothetical protein
MSCYIRLLTFWLALLASMTLSLVYSGCHGVVNSFLPLSISRTDAMVGRFALSNWVHSSPISKHLFISVSWDSSNKDESNNWPICWFSRTFQAWRRKTHKRCKVCTKKKETTQRFLQYDCELMPKTFWPFTNLEKIHEFYGCVLLQRIKLILVSLVNCTIRHRETFESIPMLLFRKNSIQHFILQHSFSEHYIKE